MSDPIVIIGTGLAGYTVAKEIRKQDQSTPILMFTQDKGRYYSKPLLSTACAQNKTIDALTISDSDKMAAALQAEICSELAVTGIDSENKQIRTQSRTYTYSKLILACGAKPNKLSIDGDAASHIHSINNLSQYENFRATLGENKNVIIIGSGLIGCEFANDLSKAGHSVSVITPQPRPMMRLIPEEIAEIFTDSLLEAGVQWIFNESASELNKRESNYEMLLASGRKLQADIVISAIGIRSNTALAEAAGIAVSRGIITDEFLRTNKEDIFALGDCAETVGQVRQFVAPISHSAKALVATINDEATAVQFPIMPVIVKTPDCPAVIVPPSNDINGSWHFDIDGNNVVGKFLDEQNKLVGFVLLGRRAMLQRMSLVQQMQQSLLG